MGEDVGNAALLLHQPAVQHRHPGADLLNHPHFVGDDHDGDAKRIPDAFQQPQNGLGGLRVKGAGGLVTQYDLWLVGKHPGNGYPLLLAAGKLGRVGVRLICQPHLFQQLQRLFPPLFSGNPPDL